VREDVSCLYECDGGCETLQRFEAWEVPKDQNDHPQQSFPFRCGVCLRETTFSLFEIFKEKGEASRPRGSGSDPISLSKWVEEHKEKEQE